AHALAAHLGAGDFHAALVAHHALEACALVFAAVALPVLGGAKDALAEEAVAFGLERAVVDRLGLGDLAVRPLADLLRGGQSDLNGVKIRKFKQAASLPSKLEIVVQVEIFVAQVEVVEVEV